MSIKKSNHRRPHNINNPVVLVVLDGWGRAPQGEFNAISRARKPNFEAIETEFGHINICASGECVGLMAGQMGNSEVGHLTIGAGRIIFQDLMRAYDEINSGKLSKNPKLLAAFRTAKSKQSKLHFIGLLSNGGVHSHIDHLFAMLRIAKDNGIEKIAVHAFLDGRDTPPRSGVDFLHALQSFLDSLAIGSIETVSGRYYAMDRDNRWDRTKLAYDAIVNARGEEFNDAIVSVNKSYDADVTDEFVVPRVHSGYSGISEGDLVVFYNFRPDRARQLTKALVFSEREFGNLFDREDNIRPKKIDMITMTIYDPEFKHVKSLLGREKVPDTLSTVLEKYKIRQLRIAETEKYAHVTYFFNGLSEKPRRFEDRILIPSAKVQTYDKKPEMSARAIAAEVVEAINSDKYGFILINFANSDMVGHSGNISATIRAVEVVDECLGEIVDAWRRKSNTLTLMVTADHGNAEKMYDDVTKQPHTAHTCNPVPLILVSKKWKLLKSSGRDAELKDIAPTILKIMGLQTPKVMTGRSLV